MSKIRLAKIHLDWINATCLPLFLAPTPFLPTATPCDTLSNVLLSKLPKWAGSAKKRWLVENCI